MDESSSNQRLIVAAILSLAVLLVWTLKYPPKGRMPQGPARPASAPTTATGAVARRSPEIERPKTSSAAPSMPAVAAEIFSFDGAVKAGEERPAIPFHVELTNEGGGIRVFELPSFKERDTKNDKTDRSIQLANGVLPFGALSGQTAGIRFIEGSTIQLPERPIYQVVQKTENSVRYRFVTGAGVEIEREYVLKKDAFELELAVTVRNHSKQDQRERLEIDTSLPIEPAMRGGGFPLMPPPDHLESVCYSDGKVRREDFKSLQKGPKEQREAVKWAGLDRQYFLTAIIQRDGVDAECRMSATNDYALSALVFPEANLKPGEERRHKMTGYFGVKKPELLTRVDSQLESAVNYTILGLNLAILAQGLLAILRMFHGLFHDWGLAILCLTVLVKLVLFPLNQRSGRSMRAMAALKPELDALKEKFPDDRQRQSEEMMKLYRKHNVSPASGCLPVLLQMPIWFALYRALWVSVDLYQQSFLWIPDLTARDPYWVLPVLLVVVMFVQQRMTPSTMDPAQQKMMMYVMPLIFGSMMAALPAGLCFYILVNSLLTIVQQHFINKSIGPVGGAVPGAKTASA
jgi:YidC/Oxa1 family membrane protein insertase